MIDPKKNLKQVMHDIKALKIQGATLIAQIGVNAFCEYAAILNLKGEELFSHLDEIRIQMINLRATEPALQNGLRYVLNKVRQEGLETVVDYGKNFEKLLKGAKEKVAMYGAERIQDGDVIFTHCHSSFVVSILTTAAEQGKSIKVVQTETRPVFQGRKTARRLVDAGIETIQVVDNAMWWSLKNFDVDLALIGADAITVEGVTLNKIGSRQLALSTAELHIPLYTCSSLLKFAPHSRGGTLSKIEMRDPDELWVEEEGKPKALKILNPAFDTVSREYVAGYITEFGIVPPQSVFYIFRTSYVDFGDPEFALKH